MVSTLLVLVLVSASLVLVSDSLVLITSLVYARDKYPNQPKYVVVVVIVATTVTNICFFVYRPWQKITKIKLARKTRDQLLIPNKALIQPNINRHRRRRHHHHV